MANWRLESGIWSLVSGPVSLLFSRLGYRLCQPRPEVWSRVLLPGVGGIVGISRFVDAVVWWRGIIETVAFSTDRRVPPQTTGQKIGNTEASHHSQSEVVGVLLPGRSVSSKSVLGRRLKKALVTTSPAEVQIT
ncbi:unnamed protein product [Protopolystoma xenopodis]|uniref:Uncharacterized protein n=1 Tax=Protopolystoma xenopodis TaxID=117903 RepID=A0A3S5BSU5_9PLAT|nr:unnamed protein product [Protopolystoma xenopodis]